ncbi:YkoY family integral membrane protein [Oikeobacillus pervagus]|uniref:YkoY family integral membrane protein n=1 Tax=Oikeobacillus pervagus TaxID=1325931 RepID=A0AAJ1WH57_9BACI|nr:TerC family protein [Oikeobacillus pervagus]MDQ0215852.1 YkoY family integral membrane protein [Oikeobacillus pervagus]
MIDGFQGILHTYAQFFDWNMWAKVLTDPVSWGSIGTLVILEGLLSADNALVLAVMVRHLPGTHRRKALFYGLIGAYAFRFIAIGLGVYLIKIWWVKVIGAAYLAWLSIHYFMEKRKGAEVDQEIKGVNQQGILIRLFGPFWGTVVAVELMDVAFSVDSILAAFGVSEEIWVLLIGGMLGVLMMRGVAGLFLRLIDRIPELETTAYIIIAFISVKMLLSVFHIEIEHTYFFSFIIFSFVITFIIHFFRKSK